MASSEANPQIDPAMRHEHSPRLRSIRDIHYWTPDSTLVLFPGLLALGILGTVNAAHLHATQDGELTTAAFKAEPGALEEHAGVNNLPRNLPQDMKVTILDPLEVS